MPKCCVCDEEASTRARGMWWCERHSKYVKDESKAEVNRREKPREKRPGQNGDSVNLELDWI